jgi:hypothetical protein
MSWHDGHPLSTTLFSSAYIDKIVTIQHAGPSLGQKSTTSENQEPYRAFGTSFLHSVLTAYCRGLIKCCDQVHSVILGQNYFEEEDFVSQKFNRSLLGECSFSDIAVDLEDCIKQLSTIASDTIKSEEKDALLCRITFRLYFLRALNHKVPETFKVFKSDLENAETHLILSQESHQLGTSVDESFSMKFQRKLASSVPPRPLVRMPFGQAVAELKKLLRDSADVVYAIKFQGSENLFTFVETYVSRQPQPSVFSKCLLQSVVFDGTKMLREWDVTDMIAKDMAEVCLPIEPFIYPDPRGGPLTIKSRLAIQQQVDSETEGFYIRSQERYVEMFRTLFNNRSRTRRVLCHSIVIWDGLQAEAEDIDTGVRELTHEHPILDSNISSEPLYMFPFSSWAYFQKLRQMEMIVQLGFELDIYEPHELTGMYVYLQIVSEARLHHLQRMKGFLTRQAQQYMSDPATEKLASNPDFVKKIRNTLAFQEFEIQKAEATQLFGSALSALYTAMKRLQIMQDPERPYGSDALRYELRIKPFMNIGSPELISFHDYTTMVNHEGDSV